MNNELTKMQDVMVKLDKEAAELSKALCTANSNTKTARINVSGKKLSEELNAGVDWDCEEVKEVEKICDNIDQALDELAQKKEVCYMLANSLVIEDKGCHIF